jgi:hypothetical protein
MSGAKSAALELLWGSILTNTAGDIIILGIVAILVVAIIFIFYKEMQATVFQRDMARAVGVPATVMLYRHIVYDRRYHNRIFQLNRRPFDIQPDFKSGRRCIPADIQYETYVSDLRSIRCHFMLGGSSLFLSLQYTQRRNHSSNIFIDISFSSVFFSEKES